MRVFMKSLLARFPSPGRFRKRWPALIVPVSILLLTSACSVVQATPGDGGAAVNITVGGPGADVGPVQILVLLTVLSLAPAIVMLMTSFTRIIIVLSLVRSAMSVPTMPPNQVLVGLALFLTLFVMAPVWADINESALQPYLEGNLAQEDAFDRGMAPLRTFMFKQTREKDISLFVDMANIGEITTPDDVPNHVLIPAFIISELKTGFQMGFIIFVPFLIIDLIVASTLMSLGMLMLPPVVISLPFKILLFVMVDGWHLVARSLLASFN